MNSTYFIQLAGITKREIRRFLKVPYQTIGTTVISTILYLLIFGVSLGRSIGDMDSESYLSFLIPGLIALGIVRNSFENASSSIIGSKYVNELQDLRITPMSNNQIILGMSIASFVRGAIVASLTLIVGIIFELIFGGAVGKNMHPFYLLFMAILTGVTFGQIGLANGIYSKNFDQVGMISSFILVPLIYLGGVFFSLDRLPTFWQMVSKVNPLLYIINGFRYGLTGKSDVSPLFCVFITLIFLFLSYFITYSGLKKGQNYFR